MSENVALIDESTSAKELRRQELEDEFSYDGYQVVRKELFAHLRDPAMTIRKDSVTFNTACIEGLEDVVYINILINEDDKRIVVSACDENNPDSLRWCVAKPDRRKSRKIMSRDFSTMLYEKMHWNRLCRYKVMGYKIEFEGETLYVFDLTQPEIFVERAKRQKTEEATVEEREKLRNEIVADESIPVDEAVRSGKLGFFPDDIKNTFGLPIEEHRKAHEVVEKDGYVTMAALTGSRR